MVGMNHDLPSYSNTLRPALLCLDGGGTRVVSQLYVLCEVMHRLAWDLNLISTKPTKGPRPQLCPADFFDYIGGGGTGAILTFLLACGYSSEEARDKFIDLSSTLVYDSQELSVTLEGLLPRHENMWWNGQFIVDLPARSNIWIAAPADPEKPHESQGTLVAKGSPILQCLLPLVLAEAQREVLGQTEVLNHTLPFLQSICPIFNDCSVLLSLGSGDVPSSRQQPPSTTTPTSSPLTAYFPTSCNPLTWLSPSSPTTSTRQEPPALPSSRASLSSIRMLNKYIPTSAYGQTYIRLNPSLVSWSTSGVQSWPADWECEKFGEHKMLISGFCSRYENGAAMDSVVDILKRKGASGTRSQAVKKETIYRKIDESMQRLIYDNAGYY